MLKIMVESLDELKDIEWERMDGVLSARIYAKLQTLTISYWDWDDQFPRSGFIVHRADVSNMVQLRMPEMSSWGILRVEEECWG
jgi:hypothetical protein